MTKNICRNLIYQLVRSSECFEMLFFLLILKVIVTTQEGVPQELPYQHIVATTQQVRIDRN